MAFNIGTLEAIIRLVDEMTPVLDKMGPKLTSVGKAMTATLTPAITGVGFAMDRAGKFGDRFLEMSARTGESIEKLQELAFAAQQTGVPFDTLATAIGQMQNRVTEGGKEISATFERMGISLQGFQALSPAAQFELLATKIQSIQDPAERTKLAMDVMGRGAMQALPLLTEDVGALMARARELGLVIDEQTVRSMEAMGDRTDELRNKLSVAVFTALAPLIEGFLKLAPHIQTAIVAGGAFLAALGPIIAVIGQLWPLILGIGQAFVWIGGVIGGIAAGPLVAVVLAIGAVVLAWAKWDAIKGIIGAVWNWLNDFVSHKAGPLLKVGGPLLNPIAAVVKIWQSWDKIETIVKDVYTAVKTWLVDRFTAVIASVKAKVEAVTGFFKDMYDKVVGQSYVPDTMNGIESQFGRLDGVMVNPSRRAVSNVDGAFGALYMSVMRHVGPLLDDLSTVMSEKLTAIFGDGGVAQTIISIGMETIFGPGGIMEQIIDAGLEVMSEKIKGWLSKLGGWLSSLWKWLAGLGGTGSGGGGLTFPGEIPGTGAPGESTPPPRTSFTAPGDGGFESLANVGSFAMGGPVRRTGLAMVHAGEYVTPAGQTSGFGMGEHGEGFNHTLGTLRAILRHQQTIMPGQIAKATVIALVKSGIR